jgi:RNA polymerase sigma factor (sigma-70 family)
MEAWQPHAAAIEAARGGDMEALERLIAVAWPHAFRIALSILHHPMSAEDAAQDACARVVGKIGELRSPGAFGIWFYRVVVREALAHVRRRTPHEPLDAADVPSASSLTDVVVRIDVLSALAALQLRQRAVVALHYYADLNSREIAAVLGVPDGTVRYLLSLARKRLEAALDAHRPHHAEGLTVRAV